MVYEFNGVNRYHATAVESEEHLSRCIAYWVCRRIVCMIRPLGIQHSDQLRSANVEYSDVRACGTVIGK